MKKRMELMMQLGHASGHCPMMGRRLVHLIHGGLRTIIDNVKNAGSEPYNQCLLASPPAQRNAVIGFELHVKSRVADTLEDKLGFVLEPPCTIAGLFGSYFGFSLEACIRIGRSLIDHWEAVRGGNSAHRVIAILFTSERLFKQLLVFVGQTVPSQLHNYPDLCCFAIKYMLLGCVGHYLEGRHRYIKVQLEGTGGSTKPGLQSFKMRSKDIFAQMEVGRVATYDIYVFHFIFQRGANLNQVCFPEVQFERYVLH